MVSEAQKQARAEMLPSGAVWMAPSARAAMMALQLSAVVFRRQWKPPQLKPWEGLVADPTQRLPQHPRVAAERAAARKRWRQRKRQHARRLRCRRLIATAPRAQWEPEAAAAEIVGLAAGRDGAVGADIAA